MTTTRRAAILIGVLFLLTEVGAIVGRLLYAPVLNTPGYVLGTGLDAPVAVGVLFEVVLVIAVVGTAVVLHPVVTRHNPALALAYVAARILEAAVILVGTLSLLTVLMLRQQPRGADEGTLETVAGALLAVQDGTLLFGPGFALGIGSLLLAWLMYTSRLVPRAIAILGLAGGAIITLSTVLVIFGVYGQFSPIGLLVALPVFAWEISLALWLIIKGFDNTAIEQISPARVGTHRAEAAR